MITLVSHMVNQVVGLRTVEAVVSGVLIEAVHDTMREIWPSVMCSYCASETTLLWHLSDYVAANFSCWGGILTGDWNMHGLCVSIGPWAV